MSQVLTSTAKALSSKSNISQQIILDIDGLPVIFGAIEVTRYAKIGDFGLTIGEFIIGGVTADPNSRNWISLDKTTNSINQSIEPDKEGASSIQKFIIQLVDLKTQVVDMFKPSKYVPDVLGRPATVYLNFKGGSHPEDSIVILHGVVDALDYGSGYVNVNVTHPDNLKKSELFNEFTAQLVGAIDNTTNTINIDKSTDGLLPAQDALGTYIRIDDEIMRVDAIAPTSLTVTRAQLSTVANSHDDEAEVTSFYRLQDKPIAMSLKMMLSGASDLTATSNSIGYISPTEIVDNCIFFSEADIQKKNGLVDGDLVTISGSIHAGNNGQFTILSFNTTPLGSYIVVVETLVNENDADLSISFKSKYNVLPTGCKMTTRQVDVARHEYFEDFFGSNFDTLDIYVKESIVAKDFLEKEVYFPSGLYPVPRQGKSSLNMTLPPLASTNTVTLNSKNIRDPDNLVISRSTNNNFYNSVVYKYHQDSLEDTFLQSDTYVSGTSLDRIEVENKPLTIEAKCFRRGSESFIERQARRFLDRYQFAAETTDVKALYRTGFNIDIGDTVILDPNGLKVADTSNGNRDFKPRLMEVKSKRFSIKKGDIELSLVDTAFEIDARYGVIAPSSLIKAGSTDTKLSLKRSFGIEDTEEEISKWLDFIDYKITVHNDDWTIVEEAEIDGIDNTLPDTIILKAPLSFTPSEDMIVDPPYYPDNEVADDQSLWKTIHCFFLPQFSVVSGTSDTVFEVSASDADKMRVDHYVRVHSDDYATDSTTAISEADAQITDITGTTITVSRSLGFTPDNTHLIDLVAFKDGELPYRYI